MKKGLIIIFFAVIAVSVYFLIFFNKPKNSAPDVKQQPLNISANTDSFNAPFTALLNKYFELKETFVNWDSAAAAKKATELIPLAGNIPLAKLKADADIVATAKSFADNVIAESKGIAGETSIAEQRRSFYTLSENLYSLIRTVRYDQAVIYHDKCPMAFNDNEDGYWLSNTRDIINPYLGNKHPKYHSGMLGCGNVEDSINYVKAPNP